MEKELNNRQIYKYQLNKKNEEKIFCVKKPKNVSSHIYLMKKSKSFYDNLNKKNIIIDNQNILNNTNNNNNLTINCIKPLTSRSNNHKIFFEKIIKLNNHKKSISSITPSSNFSCLNSNNKKNIIYKKKIIKNPLTLSKQKSWSNFTYNIHSNLKNNFKKNIKYENNSVDSTAQTDNFISFLYNTYYSTIDRDINTSSNDNSLKNIINYNNINLYSLDNNNKNKINITFNYIRNKEKRKIASNYQKKDINYILNKENINNYNYISENKNYNNIFLNKLDSNLKINKNKYDLSFNYFNKKYN